MSETGDHQLLAQFARDGSEAAFAALVQRYVNLVYSAALRHVRDIHAAEEITQAVFIVLARKAGKLSPRTALSGWLYQTARLTAANYLRTESRRVHREQEAYMQSQLDEQHPDESWQAIAPLLDTALGRLGQSDRDAIVLRFFENKNLGEVGQVIGTTEAAAKMRVNRALEKMRLFFSKRGITLSATAIAGAVSVYSVQAAPAALAHAVTGVVMAHGTVASASTVILAKATLLAMKAKTTITLVSAGAVAIVGVCIYLLCQRTPLPPRAAVPVSVPTGETVPVEFANNSFRPNFNENSINNFELGLDPDIRRTPNSAPAGHIKSAVEINAASSPTWYLMAGLRSAFIGSSYVIHQITEDSPLLGKRIRVSGWIKASNVKCWAGGQMSVVKDQQNASFDDTTDRPILGTTDWQEIEFVSDVPKEQCFVYFAPVLYGDGEIWFDDFKLDIVPPNTPLTDDHSMRFFGANPSEYSVANDYLVRHDGRPTLNIAYVPETPAPSSARLWWGEEIYDQDAEKYKGHTVRMTVWVKTENATGVVQPAFHPRDGGGKIIAREKQDLRVPATTDWIQCTTTCTIPKETHFINTGFNIAGGGKVWIDTDSFKYEIIK